MLCCRCTRRAADSPLESLVPCEPITPPLLLQLAKKLLAEDEFGQVNFSTLRIYSRQTPLPPSMCEFSLVGRIYPGASQHRQLFLFSVPNILSTVVKDLCFEMWPNIPSVSMQFMATKRDFVAHFPRYPFWPYSSKSVWFTQSGFRSKSVIHVHPNSGQLFEDCRLDILCAKLNYFEEETRIATVSVYPCYDFSE